MSTEAEDPGGPAQRAHAERAATLFAAAREQGYPPDLSCELLDACRAVGDRKQFVATAWHLVAASAEPQKLAVEAARRMPTGWPEVLALLQAAAMIAPDSAFAIAGLVMCFDRRSQAGDALRFSQRYDVVAGESGGIANHYAFEAWRGSRWAMAASWFGRLVEAMPGNFRARTFLQGAVERLSRQRAFPGVLPIASLVDAVLPPGDRTSMLIVGARGEDVDVRFQGIPPSRLEVIGVDPELGKVRDPAATDIAVRYLREVLSDRDEERTFFETRSGGGSSLFRPSRLAWRYIGPTGTRWGEQLRVTAERRVRTTSVDAVWQRGGLGKVDALYVNIQGGELAVLQGGRRTFADTVAVQAEVSFISHYEGAPDWRAVDTELTAQGFILVDIRSLNSAGRARIGLRARSDNRLGYDRWPSRQLAEAHLLYLRDPVDPARRNAALFRSTRDWLVFALWSEHHGQIEIALEALMTLVEDPGLVDDPHLVAKLATGLDAVVERYRTYLRTHFP